MAADPEARVSGVEPARVTPEQRAEPARRADILNHQGEGLAPQGGPRPAEARNDWIRDWSAIPDPLGGKALPLLMKVYRWLSWATSGTTRGTRNGPFEAVLLRRDGGYREVPPGVGWPRRTRKGSSGPRFGQHGPTGGRSGQRSWKGGQCSASRTQRPMSGCPGPCTPPSASGATARGTRNRRSPSPHANGGASDSQPQRRWPDARQGRQQGASDPRQRGEEGADQRPRAPPTACPRPPTLSIPPPPRPKSWRPRRPQAHGRERGRVDTRR